LLFKELATDVTMCINYNERKAKKIGSDNTVYIHRFVEENDVLKRV